MKKKILLLPILIAVAILTLFTGLLWVNNIYCAIHSYQAMFRGVDILLEPPSGYLKALDWSTLDVSTISTFIPFFGLLCTLVGCLRLYRGIRQVSDDFPFFQSYDRVNVSLGLIGTVWGIIIIGFFPADKISVGTLMQCLHTALFSTLVAVAWVAVLLPISLRPLMLKLAQLAIGSRGTEAGSLLDLVDQLGHSAAATGKKFEVGAEQLSRFNSTLADAGNTLNEFPSGLDTLLDKIQLVLGNLDEIGRQQSSLLQTNTAFLEKLGQEQESQLRRSTAAVERLNVIQEEFQEQNNALVKQLSEAQEQLFHKCVAIVDKVNAGQQSLFEQLEGLQKENAALRTKNKELTTLNDALHEAANSQNSES